MVRGWILVPVLRECDDRRAHGSTADGTRRMAALATPATLAMCVAALCALSPACKKPAPPDPGPDLQVVSEALRLRIGDPVPRSSPFFDGQTVKLVAARGEVLAFQVLHRIDGAVSLELQAPARVTSYDVEAAIA